MKVSIITPSFNRADVIRETAQSIFNQTYRNWEWVITDDGSTDESMQVLRQYAAADDRVKVLQREREPKGACTCRNISVENSTGDYLLFLDSDDLLASFCLQQRVRTMQENPDCDFAIFSMLIFSQKPGDMMLLWNIDSPKDDIERILLGDAICQGTGTLWKKDSFVKIGMWDEKLLLWQDVELHLRSLLFPMKYCKRLDFRPDVFIRVSDISLSRTNYHSLAKFRSRLSVFQSTLERMSSRDLLARYRSGLRSLYADLFVSAAKNNFKEEIDVIYKVQHKYNFFNSRELLLFKGYAIIMKLKLFKVPLVQRFALYNLQKVLPTAETSLNKVVYRKPVEL